MSKLKEADFYYGAILSHCFHNGFKPMMVEGGDSRQVYDCTTDSGDFRLFTKYRSAPISSKTEGYNSWQFVLSDGDIAELSGYLKMDGELSLALLCGNTPFKESEIAFLHKDEIQTVLNAEKGSITISRKAGERKFRIAMGGGRDNSLQIEAKRVR